MGYGYMIKRYQRGYSLLELMLVLVIVASAVLYISIWIQNQAQERQIDRTSVEMQNIMQGIADYYLFRQNQFYSAYAFFQTNKNDGESLDDFITKNFNPPLYVKDNGKIYYQFWPETSDELLCPSGGGTYVNWNAFCSPWSASGNPCHSSSSCGTTSKLSKKLEAYQLVYDREKQYMGVKITLPSTQLAAKLAVKLPGSIQEGTTVTAYLSRPVARYNPSLLFKQGSDGKLTGTRGWITSAGAVSGWVSKPKSSTSPSTSEKDRSIVLPNCPTGYEGHYILGYMKLRTGVCRPAAFAYYWDESGSWAWTRSYARTLQLFANTFQSDPTGETGGSTQVTVNNVDYKDKSPTQTCDTMSWHFDLTGKNPGIFYVFPGMTVGYKVSYFMSFCIPNGSWQINAGYTAVSNKGSNPNVLGQVLQCRDKWKDYNSEASSYNTKQCDDLEAALKKCGNSRTCSLTG